MAQATTQERIKSGHDYSFQAPNVGMSDDNLIGYCDIHSDTPRGMFTKHQISRLIFLAGSPSGFLSPEEYLTENNKWVYCGTQFTENNKAVRELIKKAEKCKAKN